MQMKLRKLWPLLGLMCMSVVGTANADTYNSRSDSMSSSSQGSMDSKGMGGTYERGTYREITPNAGPRVAAGADVFVTANFIWWKAVQEGTSYAITNLANGRLASDTSIPDLSRGSAKSVGHDWAPGFKVGLGLNLSHDGWDLFAQYTWLRASNKDSLTASTAGLLQPMVATQNNSSTVWPQGLQRADATWSLSFNVVDAELGRNFYLSQYLTMRPFFGLKGTWQHSNCKTKYYAAEGSTFPTADPDVNLAGPYRISNHMKTWGIGTRGGFNLAWYMTKDWSFYGNMAWTAMWTDCTEMRRKDRVENGTGVASVPYNAKDNKHFSVKNILEMELGIRWEIWFNDDNYHLSIQAGWEEQVWNNWCACLNQLTGESWDDLTFQGLNLKVRFDF